MASIAVIEDDRQLGTLVKSYLESFSHEVAHFLSPKDGLLELETKPFDILILDIMLPEMDGFEVLEKLRTFSSLPVIMLTARGDVTDKITGLELGADDYMPKPFEPRELLARIEAVLRRSQKITEKSSDIIQFDSLLIDYKKREASLDNVNIELTTAEFELLDILVKSKGAVLTRDDIMNSLQGIDSNVFSRSIDISVSRLRQKLGDSAKEVKFIKTIWGKGYMFIGGDSEA